MTNAVKYKTAQRNQTKMSAVGYHRMNQILVLIDYYRPLAMCELQ